TTDGPAWRTFGERPLYDNRWVRLTLVDVAAPNGERWEHHVISLDQGAIAMRVNDQGEVLMLHRYRFAVDQWGYELLGGLVEEGEAPAKCVPAPPVKMGTAEEQERQLRVGRLPWQQRARLVERPQRALLVAD